MMNNFKLFFVRLGQPKLRLLLFVLPAIVCGLLLITVGTHVARQDADEISSVAKKQIKSPESSKEIHFDLKLDNMNEEETTRKRVYPKLEKTTKVVVEKKEETATISEFKETTNSNRSETGILKEARVYDYKKMENEQNEEKPKVEWMEKMSNDPTEVVSTDEEKMKKKNVEAVKELQAFENKLFTNSLGVLTTKIVGKAFGEILSDNSTDAEKSSMSGNSTVESKETSKDGKVDKEFNNTTTTDNDYITLNSKKKTVTDSLSNSTKVRTSTIVLNRNDKAITSTTESGAGNENNETTAETAETETVGNINTNDEKAPINLPNNDEAAVIGSLQDDKHVANTTSLEEAKLTLDKIIAKAKVSLEKNSRKTTTTTTITEEPIVNDEDNDDS